MWLSIQGECSSFRSSRANRAEDARRRRHPGNSYASTYSPHLNRVREEVATRNAMHARDA